MGKKLNTHVWVDGTWYGPDDDVPAEVAKQIDNPKVWESDEDADAKPATRSSRKSSTEKE